MMKTAILIFFLFCFSIGQSQWIVQSTGITDNLYDIKFIDKKTGWAVGDAGRVIKTIDGGLNWINIPNPSGSISPNVWDVFPIDSNIVYVTSSGDFLMKTTNGGTNWNVLHYCPDCNSSFIGTYFLNKDTGWFSGANKVMRTYNGGITLDSFYTPAFSHHDIYFKDINTGLFCGDGSVYKSTNGGVSWYQVILPTEGTFYMFRDIAVVGNTVWLAAGGNPPILRSTDFGDTWSIIDTLHNYPPSVVNSIAFSSQNTGWLGGTYGYLYKTTDGGFSWARENTGTDQRFWGAIFCYNDSIVWGAGGAGKVMYTTTGGQTMVGISNNQSYLPDDFELLQNYPNPFNPVTIINYGIKKYSYVEINVYDLLGKKINSLVQFYLSPGNYSTQFNGSNYASGIYYYDLKIDGEIKAVRKMMLLK